MKEQYPKAYKVTGRGWKDPSLMLVISIKVEFVAIQHIFRFGSMKIKDHVVFFATIINTEA
eukprot:snap_masked-scaffold_5-processed-gene-20.75-mRNA-1 protein AED:1.00 eAED:1.00 QI:0/0/0/0/1/1/2/0/60